MKKIGVLLLVSLFFITSCNKVQKGKNNECQVIEVDTCEGTLDFYDNEAVIDLKGDKSIKIDGEVDKAYEVDFKKLPLRSLIVKEMLYNTSANDSFVGAYRYDGYAIDDILNLVKPKKKPVNTLSSNIDLYLVISNNKGDSVVLSWGEVFYPIHRHEIIIATKVMRIVPSKTKEQWPLPVETKLIVASDLMTVRNISNPTNISIRSAYFDESKGGKKGDTAYVKEFTIFDNDEALITVSDLPKDETLYEFPTVFYGRGRGIHSVTPFNGVLIKNILLKHFPVNINSLQRSMILASGNDGYRVIFSFSEIMNRNDQAELLLVELERKIGKSGAKFRLLPASDFFSDRSVKSLLYLKYIK